MCTNRNETLNILYINIRSLRNKLDDINDIIKQSQKVIHLIILTETWIYSNEKQFFNINKYNAVHDCRNRRGGGTSIFIREEFEFIENDATIYDLHDCNIVSIILPKHKLKIFGIYRPPQSIFENFIDQLDKMLEAQKEECILIGDINLDLLKNTQVVKNYKNTINMNGFTIQNEITLQKATRTTLKTKTILDHILSNKNIKCLMTLEDHIVSDHKVIKIEVTKIKLKRNFEKITRNYLDHNKWANNVKARLRDQEITSFKEIVEIIQKEKANYTKEYTLKIKENNYWVTFEYIRKIKYRDKLYRRMKIFPNEYTEREFKKIKNEANDMRKKLQKEYAEKKLWEASGDCRKTWSVLNELCNKKSSKKRIIDHVINKKGQNINNDKEIATSFNEHFSSIGQYLASKIVYTRPAQFQEEQVSESIFLNPTNSDEIKNILIELKNNCAPGPDYITKKDLLIIWESIEKKIVQIINKILECGIYPEELKIAKVVPVYKKGSHEDLNNYRPISLLSTFSKITEKVIKSRMISFINSTFQFDSNQYGFQERSNTLGATTDLLDYITNEIDKNRYVLTVFIDLQKAFDTVNIELLIKKLNNLGFRGKCSDLLKSYSSGRKQFTFVNSNTSSLNDISVGVAQGSVLGPLQYLLYVHSLKFAGLQSKYYMFADDTVLVFSAKSEDELERIVNLDINLYYEWLCYNKLSINVNKSVYMIIKQKGKKACNPKINLNNQLLKQVSEYKYLGLIISNNLTWNSHISNIINKVAPIVGALKRCSHQLNENTRYLLYNSFIEPHLRYLIPCWGNASEYLMKKLQRLQNKSIKALFTLNYYTPSEDLYRTYPFLTINQLRKFEQTKLIHNVKNKIIKANTILKQNKDYHNYNIRSKDALRNTFANSKKKQDSPYEGSIQTYNNIPDELFNERRKKVLHTNLKKHIKETVPN